MDQKRYLLKGTFLLTGAGLLARLAGFFYKIFLSRTIGAGQIGLFQLALPVFALCTALCIGGIQTAVSRFTAEYHAKNDRRSAYALLVCSLVLSVCASCLCAAALFVFAPQIAAHFLLEPLCSPLLQIGAVSLPFCAVHACISGYFLGCKNVSVPAYSQLLEQFARIGSVFLFYCLFLKSGRSMSAAVMALGQIAGEICSSLFCSLRLLYQKPEKMPQNLGQTPPEIPFFHQLRKLLSAAAPLGMNRTLLCVLQGMEAALLPQMLRQFGLGAHEALSVYGTLTGMTMPLLLFPTAVTGAVGTLLLPAVSEANTLNQNRQISSAVNASFQAAIFLGMFFTTAFFLFGRSTGAFLFHNELSGVFLQKLSLLCPFLYLNTTIVGILHGLGKSAAVFLFNIAGFFIRIGAVIFYVAEAGIDAYLAAAVLSQMLTAVCYLLLLRRDRALTVSISGTFLRAFLMNIAGVVCVTAFFYVMTGQFSPFGASFPVLTAAVCLLAAVFIFTAWFLAVPSGMRKIILLKMRRTDT